MKAYTLYTSVLCAHIQYIIIMYVFHFHFSSHYYSHAHARRPEKICGLLSHKPNAIVLIESCTNMLLKYHNIVHGMYFSDDAFINSVTLRASDCGSKLQTFAYKRPFNVVYYVRLFQSIRIKKMDFFSYIIILANTLNNMMYIENIRHFHPLPVVKGA